MAADRHFRPTGHYSNDQLAAQIKDDIEDYHATGQTARVDGLLDELNDVNNGTWTSPNYS